MRWHSDPEAGRSYVTEDGLLYYVLSVTFDSGQVRLKYLVLSDEHVEPRHKKHMMEVGDIGDYVGSANIKWTDQRVD